MCRGNYHSTYAFEGGYDPIAPYLFAHEDVDAFYLEFDTPRAGGFEPLKYVAPGKKVVLGLVTTKAAELENEDVIVERIREAASGQRSRWSSALLSAFGSNATVCR